MAIPMHADHRDIITKVCDRLFGIDSPDERWEEIAKSKIAAYEKSNLTDLEVQSQTTYYKLIMYDVLKLISAGMPQKQLKGMQILEAGCGTGLLTIALARRGAHGWLMDNSPYWYKYAKILGERAKKSRDFGGDVDYLKTDVRDRGFLKKYANFFDLVHNEGVIEHYQPREASEMIRDMASVTKRGGCVMVAVPNFFSPDMVALWLAHGKLDELFYTRGMLKRAIVDGGLEDVKIVTSSLALPHWAKSRIVKATPFSVEKFIGRTLRLGFLHIGIGTRP